METFMVFKEADVHPKVWSTPHLGTHLTNNKWKPCARCARAAVPRFYTLVPSVFVPLDQRSGNSEAKPACAVRDEDSRYEIEYTLSTSVKTGDLTGGVDGG